MKPSTRAYKSAGGTQMAGGSWRGKGLPATDPHPKNNNNTGVEAAVTSLTVRQSPRVCDPPLGSRAARQHPPSSETTTPTHTPPRDTPATAGVWQHAGNCLKTRETAERPKHGHRGCYREGFGLLCYFFTHSLLPHLEAKG